MNPRTLTQALTAPTAAFTLALAVLVLGTAANAAVIVADDFNDKTDGQLGGQGGGYNGTGAWTSDWAGTAYNIVSGELRGKNGEDVRTFSGIAQGETVYFGATFYQPSSDNMRFSVDLNGRDWTFGLRDNKYSLDGGKTGSTPLATYVRIVLRLEQNYNGTQDRMQMYWDNFEDGTFDVSEANPGATKAGEFFSDPITALSIHGVALGPLMRLDDLNIVTTFREAGNATTPEPATLALLGLGAAAMLAGRKRRA